MIKTPTRALTAGLLRAGWIISLKVVLRCSGLRYERVPSTPWQSKNTDTYKGT
jgi:hypothetical protein